MSEGKNKKSSFFILRWFSDSNRSFYVKTLPILVLLIILAVVLKLEIAFNFLIVALIFTVCNLEDFFAKKIDMSNKKAEENIDFRPLLMMYKFEEPISNLEGQKRKSEVQQEEEPPEKLQSLSNVKENISTDNGEQGIQIGMESSRKEKIQMELSSVETKEPIEFLSSKEYSCDKVGKKLSYTEQRKQQESFLSKLFNDSDSRKKH